MPNYYPIMFDLENKQVLVVGGGIVALRKVETLIDHGAIVQIIAPELIPELKEIVDNQKCTWIKKQYASSDLNGAVLVFSCTNNDVVNATVAHDAKKNLRPVNVVDDPDKCTFIVPSIMNRGDLTIAVSTSGSSPIVARQIRAEIEEVYGNEIAKYLELLKRWRFKVKTELPNDKRSLFWDQVTDGKVRSLIKEDHIDEAEGVIKQCFQSLLG